VEKLQRLNWTTHLFTAEYNGEFPLIFLSEWSEIPSALCLVRKKKTLCEIASRCCWNSARYLTHFLSAFVTRKGLQFGTWAAPSFQRH